jgi:hypothetical protein
MSKPSISSSLVTLSPIVFFKINNTIKEVMIAHAAIAKHQLLEHLIEQIRLRKANLGCKKPTNKGS